LWAILFSAGSIKAAVLPLPVWADTIKSAPAKAAGIADIWTGVGVVKPVRSMEDNKAGTSPNESKDMTFLLAR
jgi:hypothetical protein